MFKRPFTLRPFVSQPLFLPSIIALLLVVLAVNLGAWQLRRADEKRLDQQQREQLVTIIGEFEPSKTIFVDNRTRKGVAGLHVLTPLRLTHESTPKYLLVLRGWVARPAGSHQLLPGVQTPSGTVQLQGVQQSSLGKAPFLNAANQQGIGAAWSHVETQDYAKASGLPMQAGFFRQYSDSGDELLRDWPAPSDGVNKHLGYAFQWFAMALAVLGVWLYLAVLKPGKKSDHNDPNNTK